MRLSRELMPDLAIVFLGTNEAVSPISHERLCEQITDFVEQLREANPSVAVVLIPPMDSRRKMRKSGTMVWSKMYVEEVRNAMKQVAEQSNVAMWDFYEIAGGAGAYSRWVGAKLMQGDNIHLSIRGYKVHSRLLYEALMKDFNRWREQNNR